MQRFNVPHCTVDEREELMLALERDIIHVLQEKALRLPVLLEYVARRNHCPRDDVAAALARISRVTEQFRAGGTIWVRRYHE